MIRGRLLCTIMTIRGGAWIIIPRGMVVEIEPFYHRYGKEGCMKVKSDRWARVKGGEMEGCILPVKLLSMTSRIEMWKGHYKEEKVYVCA